MKIPYVENKDKKAFSKLHRVNSIYAISIIRKALNLKHLLTEAAVLCIRNELHFNINEIIKNKNHREDLRIRWKYRQRRICGGSENPNKIFYVIRVSFATGIFSFVEIVVSKCLYAKKMGYIPVVDAKTLAISGCLDKMNKNENTWEQYFEQPAGYSLSDIENSKNIIIASGIGEEDVREAFDFQKYDFHKNAEYWYKRFCKYCRLNKTVIQYLKKESVDLYQEGRRVLGVALRRGIPVGIAAGRTAGLDHPKELGLEDAIAESMRIMKKHQLDYLFCVSDDAEAIEVFKEFFGDKLIFVDRERVNFFKNGKIIFSYDSVPVPKETPYEKTLAYITEIALLSQCTALIGGRNAGTVMASIWNKGKYEYVDIQDKSKYWRRGKRFLSEKDGYVMYNL